MFSCTYIFITENEFFNLMWMKVLQQRLMHICCYLDMMFHLSLYKKKTTLYTYICLDFKLMLSQLDYLFVVTHYLNYNGYA